MGTTLVEALAVVRAELARVDVALWSGDDCVGLVEALATIEKACGAVRARAALRAKECGAHRERGFTDASDWLGRVTGVSGAEAQRVLSTAEGLRSVPSVGAAATAGEVSLAQAHELVMTEAVVPGLVVELLEDAKRQPLPVLRDRARSLRLAADDVYELNRRQHVARSLRHWRDGSGMVCGRFALAPEVGVPFVNRLDVATDRIRRQARRSGATERREAHAADALVALGTASERRSPRAEVVYVCDVRAAARGHTEPGEPCHIVGGGPVPPDSVAAAVAAGAFVKAVTHEGTRIESIVHWGRHIPAEIESALRPGSPPGFEGAQCADGCGRRYGLERDHIDPVANGGPTTYTNLEFRCYTDHAAKTARDRARGKLDHPP